MPVLVAHEFEATLVYRADSRTVKATQEKSCLETQKQTNKVLKIFKSLKEP